MICKFNDKLLVSFEKEHKNEKIDKNMILNKHIFVNTHVVAVQYNISNLAPRILTVFSFHCCMNEDEIHNILYIL
jgi:hypothetical protein